MTATPSIDHCRAFLEGDGPSNSLTQAIASKLTAAQLRERLRQEKLSMDAYLAERSKKTVARPAPAPTGPLKTLAAQGETKISINRLKRPANPPSPAVKTPSKPELRGLDRVRAAFQR